MDVGLFEGLALVVAFAAAADSQEHLGASLFEVHLQRHEREPLFVRLGGNAVDLTAVQ